MKVTREVIGPKQAEQLLNRNTSNRKLRTGVVEKYASDMKAGRWTESIDPIAFYTNGDLANGQHRLWAVVESKAKQEFLIIRGLSRAAGLNIDAQLMRTLVDNARISGIDADLTFSLVAVARAVAQGDRQVSWRSPTNKRAALTYAEQAELVNSHREECLWAIHNGPVGRYIRNAIVLAAIARAYRVEEDHERLARFAEVLGKGFSEGTQESAAIAFRNYLQSKGPHAAQSSMWRDTFLKAQNAIWYFMRGRQLTTIKSIEEERYPLNKKKAK